MIFKPRGITATREPRKGVRTLDCDKPVFSMRKKLDHSFDPNLCQRDYLKLVWEQITKSMGSNEAASVP